MTQPTVCQIVDYLKDNPAGLRWELRDGCIRAPIPNDPAGRTCSPATAQCLVESARPAIKFLAIKGDILAVFLAQNRLHGHNPRLRRRLLEACGLAESTP